MFAAKRRKGIDMRTFWDRYSKKYRGFDGYDSEKRVLLVLDEKYDDGRPVWHLFHLDGQWVVPTTQVSYDMSNEENRERFNSMLRDTHFGDDADTGIWWYTKDMEKSLKTV